MNDVQQIIFVLVLTLKARPRFQRPIISDSREFGGVGRVAGVRVSWHTGRHDFIDATFRLGCSRGLLCAVTEALYSSRSTLQDGGVC
jgi:hypothetical protein